MIFVDTYELVTNIGGYRADALIELLDQADFCGEEREFEIDITSACAGRDAVMYMPNGDPGYPAEPAEVEFEFDVTADEFAAEVYQNVVKALTDYFEKGVSTSDMFWKSVYKYTKARLLLKLFKPVIMRNAVEEYERLLYDDDDVYEKACEIAFEEPEPDYDYEPDYEF